MIIALDMGGDCGVCLLHNGKYYHWTLNKVDNKNIVNKLCEFILKELWYLNLEEVDTVVTFLPNVFSGFFYQVLKKQFWLYWILDHHFNTVILKESAANKDILGRNKRRKKKGVKAETTKEWKQFTVDKINELWFDEKSHDSCDAIKAMLAYQKQLQDTLDS